MKKNIENFIKKFEEIKKMGWIKSCRKGSGGIGRTFENLLGKEEETSDFPDYNGIELKTRRISAKYAIDLFSLAPSNYKADELRLTYGYISPKFDKFKVFIYCIGCNEFTYTPFYGFKMQLDYPNKKMYLVIVNNLDANISKNIYWDLDILKEKVLRKLNILALVKAESIYIDWNENFHYKNLKIYENIIFEKFLKLLEKGIICVNFNISVYLSKEYYGKTNYHGINFCISEENLHELYEKFSEYN